jgi:hypothetical protein
MPANRGKQPDAKLRLKLTVRERECQAVPFAGSSILLCRVSWRELDS